MVNKHISDSVVNLIKTDPVHFHRVSAVMLYESGRSHGHSFFRSVENSRFICGTSSLLIRKRVTFKLCVDALLLYGKCHR